MVLNDLILNGEGWNISGNFLMFKKLQNIPVCYIKDNIVYIFLDARITKEIIRFTKSLINKGVEFFFTTPTSSNPKGVNKLEYEILYNYLLSYANSKFFYGFKKINFDLIDNMIKWSKFSNTTHLIKSVYEDVNRKVQSKNWHFIFDTVMNYKYSDEIRDNFNSLYRHIQICKIL
jgi:hypothetical protein